MGYKELGAGCEAEHKCYLRIVKKWSAVVRGTASEATEDYLQEFWPLEGPTQQANGEPCFALPLAYNRMIARA